MTTDDSRRPTIPHAARCGRRGAPILRASDYTRPESLHGPVVRNYTHHYTHCTRTELHAGPPLFREGPVVGVGEK